MQNVQGNTESKSYDEVLAQPDFKTYYIVLHSKTYCSKGATWEQPGTDTWVAS